MALSLPRLTVERYERMAELGLLPNRGVELFDGLVVEMSPKGVRHAHAMIVLNKLLVLQSNERYDVYPDSLSLRLGPHDEPDPDIALVRATRSYARERATVADVALIIEVADSSFAFDLGKKLRKYAGARIPEYWVIDLKTDTAHQFWDPLVDGYQGGRIAAATETIVPREYPDVSVSLGQVFGVDA